MKAPDKIYIAESLIKAQYGNEWSPTAYVSRENTEYIRKDVILDWAENALEEYAQRREIFVIAELIEKINSL